MTPKQLRAYCERWAAYWKKVAEEEQRALMSQGSHRLLPFELARARQQVYEEVLDKLP